MKERAKTPPGDAKTPAADAARLALQPRLTEALERLVQLYEALDKKEDAAKWRRELEATKAAQQQAVKLP